MKLSVEILERVMFAKNRNVKKIMEKLHCGKISVLTSERFREKSKCENQRKKIREKIPRNFFFLNSGNSFDGKCAMFENVMEFCQRCFLNKGNKLD